MKKKFGAVIIDLDGTLVDTAPDFLVAVNYMLSFYKKNPVNIDEVRNLIGKGPEYLIRNILALYYEESSVEALLPEASKIYQDGYEKVNGKHSSLYPGVIDGLKILSNLQMKLVCLTNKPQQNAEALLEQTGLLGFFHQVYGGDAVPARKPSPLGILQICSELNLSPGQILIIGDSENDAQAARLAGAPVYLLPYGYNHGIPIDKVQSDGVMDNLLAVASSLDG